MSKYHVEMFNGTSFEGELISSGVSGYLFRDVSLSSGKAVSVYFVPAPEVKKMETLVEQAEQNIEGASNKVIRLIEN